MWQASDLFSRERVKREREPSSSPSHTPLRCSSFHSSETTKKAQHLLTRKQTKNSQEENIKLSRELIWDLNPGPLDKTVTLYYTFITGIRQWAHCASIKTKVNIKTVTSLHWTHLFVPYLSACICDSMRLVWCNAVCVWLTSLSFSIHAMLLLSQRKSLDVDQRKRKSVKSTLTGTTVNSFKLLRGHSCTWSQQWCKIQENAKEKSSSFER